MAKTTTMITMVTAHTVAFGRKAQKTVHKDTRGERPVIGNIKKMDILALNRESTRPTGRSRLYM